MRPSTVQTFSVCFLLVAAAFPDYNRSILGGGEENYGREDGTEQTCCGRGGEVALIPPIGCFIKECCPYASKKRRECLSFSYRAYNMVVLRRNGSSRGASPGSGSEELPPTVSERSRRLWGR